MSMSEKTIKAIEEGKKPLGKDVSSFPGNEEGSVQSIPDTQMERDNTARERRRLDEERKHHEETGS
jgi:hypothetical protein